MNVGDRVRLLREKKGMTQEELATQLGYKSKSSVTHIENGRDIPRSMVVKLADILDTSPAYLMGWSDINEQITDYKEQINDYIKASIEYAHEISDALYAYDAKYIVHYYSKLNSAGRIEATKRVAEMAKLDEYTNPDGESVQITEKTIAQGDREYLNPATSEQESICITRVAARNGNPPEERLRTQEEIDEIRSRPDADPDL